MINFNVLKTALCGLLFAISGQALSSAKDLRVKSIDVPVYNLISDTLVGMSSPVKGQRNDFVMHLICDLARGDKTQQNVNDVLEKNNVDFKSIPQQGSMASLLINGAIADQMATCAAYLASSLWDPLDNSLLPGKVEGKAEGKEPEINAERTVEAAKVKMTLAQATANLYAVIASNMKSDSRKSFIDYQQDVAKTVYDYAPEYLNLVKQLYTNDRATYKIETLTSTTMEVTDNYGRELKLSQNSIIMKSRGVIWLGEGKILGKEYFIPVAITQIKFPVSKSKNK